MTILAFITHSPLPPPAPPLLPPSSRHYDCPDPSRRYMESMRADMVRLEELERQRQQQEQEQQVA
jgi:hypothetical protein